jgi:LruC domain-containing protein
MKRSLFMGLPMLWLAGFNAHALQLGDLLFESGAGQENYSLLGKPNATYNISATLPADVLANVYSLVPEGQEINPDFIASGKSTSIAIDDELNGAEFAEVSITFLNEGAGFRNSLGYFVFDTASPPQAIDDIQTHVIVFPNVSKAPDGELQEGDTIDLSVQLTAGQSIGFFVLANGWGSNGSYNTIASLGNRGTPYYSLTSLNPEPTEFDRNHSVLFVDTENEFMVIGFEDLFRPYGDNDFNDALFTVKVTPFTAVDGVNVDGTTNGNLEVLTQSNNPQTTITSYYPSADTWGSLAYEDNWPRKGDYDFNDVVMNYRITETINGLREIIRIKADFRLQAMGAGFHNGFALHLPSVLPGNVASATLTRKGQVQAVSADVDHSGETVFVLSQDTREDVQAAGALTEGCRYFRVEAGCLSAQTQLIDYSLVVEFVQPVAKSSIGVAPYDPFIFATPETYHGIHGIRHPGKSWQTHLKNFAGTATLDRTLFSQADDATDLAASFVTGNAFPWVLNIGSDWVHPREGVDISLAYPKFPQWVSSNGETNTDWYAPQNAVTGNLPD